ncbi:MAG: hypothetical protein R3F60_07330 [bacterium]
MWELADGIAAEATPATEEGRLLEQDVPEDEIWSARDLPADRTRQFVTLYESLEGFDDTAALPQLTSPRLCFAGSADAIHYGQAWGDVNVRLADPLAIHRETLTAFGWTVHLFDHLDHQQAMQASVVLPLLKRWLLGHLPAD